MPSNMEKRWAKNFAEMTDRNYFRSQLDLSELTNTEYTYDACLHALDYSTLESENRSRKTNLCMYILNILKS